MIPIILAQFSETDWAAINIGIWLLLFVVALLAVLLRLGRPAAITVNVVVAFLSASLLFDDAFGVFQRGHFILRDILSFGIAVYLLLFSLYMLRKARRRARS